jgi:hypothetical protein
MFPALALLGGRELAARDSGALRIALVSLTVAALLLAASAFALPSLERLAALADDLRRYAPWMLAASALAFAAAWFAQRLAGRRRLRALALVAAAALGAQLLLVNGAQVFADRFSTERLVVDAEWRWGALDRAVPFYSVELYDQTLPLHLGRTLTLVDYRDELDEGLRLQPAVGLADLDAFRRAWAGAMQAYAVMRPARFAAERDSGLPMTVLAQDARYVIVARSAAPLAGPRRPSAVW